MNWESVEVLSMYFEDLNQQMLASKAFALHLCTKGQIFVPYTALAAHSMAPSLAVLQLLRLQKKDHNLSMAFAAGVFDIAENLLMLQSIGGNYTDASLILTWYCAAIKFLVIAVIILYLLLSLPKLLGKKAD